MFQTVIRSHFDAAHYLRNYQGKCARLHGHRWDVEICVEGERLDRSGMLVDFGEMKRAVSLVLNQLDHQLLNDVPEFQGEKNPTAENIAGHLYREIRQTLVLPSLLRLAWVKVYESPDAWALYKED